MTANSSALTYSSCRISDWKELAEVFSACFPQVSPPEIAYQLTRFKDGIRVLRSEGRIVGFTVRIEGKAPQTAWLEYIGVGPAGRGRGLGEMLLSDFEVQCVRRGLGRVELAVHTDNSAAIRLYERSGFARLERASSDGKFAYAKTLQVERAQAVFRADSLSRRLKGRALRTLYRWIVD